MAKVVYTPGPEVWAVTKGFMKKRYVVTSSLYIKESKQDKPGYRTLRAAKKFADYMTSGPSNIYVVLDTWND